ncbi:hypothetical protein F5050DRAFT_1876128 [Lentinula boryana]|uniref:Uncharacterized protein n=1 Tax=Lentinula boryana TaxID=40481 RepID=A0ABQ8QGQ9_9AGAR|nr:hypothetical protein F5050DRAFT_1876128 [Lentinula boryana]
MAGVPPGTFLLSGLMLLHTTNRSQKAKLPEELVETRAEDPFVRLSLSIRSSSQVQVINIQRRRALQIRQEPLRKMSRPDTKMQRQRSSQALLFRLVSVASQLEIHTKPSFHGLEEVACPFYYVYNNEVNENMQLLRYLPYLLYLLKKKTHWFPAKGIVRCSPIQLNMRLAWFEDQDVKGTTIGGESCFALFGAGSGVTGAKIVIGETAAVVALAKFL